MTCPPGEEKKFVRQALHILLLQVWAKSGLRIARFSRRTFHRHQEEASTNAYITVVVGGAVVSRLVATLAVTHRVRGGLCGIRGRCGWDGGGNLTDVVWSRGATRRLWPVAHLV